MRARTSVAAIALALLGACVGDGHDGDSTDAASSSSTRSPSSSSASSADPTDAPTTAATAHDAELLRAQFTIPAGTKVAEFDFDAAGTAPDFATAGAGVTVAVLDLSHPGRDQASLCASNHPLSGCATVDDGAFGVTHDNRLTVAGDGGPLSRHLHKDRSVQPEAEVLAPDE